MAERATLRTFESHVEWGSVENKPQWRELGEKAATEQDPQKLMEVTKEIIRLLDEKEARLKQASRKIPPEV